MHWRKTLFLISTVYLIVLLVSVLAVLAISPFEDVGHLEQGCYLTDAMVPYVECRGFFGHSLLEFIFNMPFLLLYLPVFGAMAFLRAPWLIFLAVFAWSPIIYFIWYLIKKPKKINKLSGV